MHLNWKWHRDAKRVQEAAGGDKLAAEQLVAAHYASVFRLLLHLTGSHPKAEDLTQETFLKAWRRLDQFSGRSSFKTWLFRIAYRETFAQQNPPPLLQLDEERFDPGQDFAQSLLDAVAIERAILTLPHDLRVTFLIHEVQGLSVNETAEVLGIPKGTVLSRLSAGRERLRRQLTMRDVVANTAEVRDPKAFEGAASYETR